MDSLSDKLLEKKYNTCSNWLKAHLAVSFTKEGLEPFVCDEIQQFQLKCLDDICSKNGLSHRTLCSECSTENHVKCRTKGICVIKKGQCNYHRNASLQFISTCPNRICHHFKCEIKTAHWYECPSFKNTDATQWCSNYWEVAKCFMPPDGYKDKASAADTDFNGIISVILNYKGFQDKIDESLQDDTSVFKAAREAVNKLRHSNLEVEDSYLQELLIILQKLLSDSKYLAQDTHAQQASEHLKQLKIDTLTISNDYLRKAHEQYERVKLDEEKRKQEDLLNGDENDGHDNIDNNNDNNYAPIARAGDETQTAPIPPKFEEELIQWYIKNKLSLQLSMTDDSVDTKFEDLYVKQELSDHRTGKLETSLKDLFTSEGKVSLDIFLCSIVGAGNTTFAKYLTRLWCQSHGQGSDHNDNFQEEDLNALRDIDFVFLLNLTDSSSKCDTEDMIYDQIIQNLPCNSSDGKSFLKQVLKKKRCLIILDESDRWEHPQKCTKSFQGIPHRYASENIIVVTIARQRKLVNINDSQINKEIEINRLGNKSKKQLQINALKGIAEKKNETVTEEELKNQQEAFQSEISAYNLDELASVPLILMHLVCLWHDNCFKVLSECQVYGKIIEMILSTTQKNFQYFQTNDFKQLQASGYKELLDGLGNLASHSFKGGKTIARSVVNKFLKEEQAKLCLISGILSESNGKICSEQNNPEIYFTFENIRKHFRQRLQKSE
ncbi:uncharacterized protein LOC132715459 [Ruditapes philippinarum]|uniref:uncharacterized protein LOC132715459 n=1 Tax=Ruditapes philippinarum TaxID=129788 RepID=UPI00295B41F4|nr:uncharacterized protein LOC132715459 [Ruditapes philippinarum]